MQQVAGQHSHLGIPPPWSPYVVVPLPLHAPLVQVARRVPSASRDLDLGWTLARGILHNWTTFLAVSDAVMIKDCFDGGRWGKAGSFEVYVWFRRRSPHDLKTIFNLSSVVSRLTPHRATFLRDRRCTAPEKKEKRLLVNLIYRTGLYLATIAGFQCIYVYIKKEFVF